MFHQEGKNLERRYVEARFLVSVKNVKPEIIRLISKIKERPMFKHYWDKSFRLNKIPHFFFCAKIFGY